MDTFYDVFISTGNSVVTSWLMVFVVWSAVLMLARFFSNIKKIQKRPFSKVIFRHELLYSAMNLAVTIIVLKVVSTYFVEWGFIQTNPEPAAWWVIALEFTAYFFIFDLYFYAFHRLIHLQPLYRWIHIKHHRSVSPNPLSSSSMHPLEGIGEGLIIPIFLALVTIHEASMPFIVTFATLMGLYVHCGHEFAPRWWYRTWFSKWLITPMFHDQHHQYFNFNYGGFTTIWDYLFGTVRPRFESDFEALKAPAADKKLSASTA